MLNKYYPDPEGVSPGFNWITLEKTNVEKSTVYQYTRQTWNKWITEKDDFRKFFGAITELYKDTPPYSEKMQVTNPSDDIQSSPTVGREKTDTWVPFNIYVNALPCSVEDRDAWEKKVLPAYLDNTLYLRENRPLTLNETKVHLEKAETYLLNRTKENESKFPKPPQNEYGLYKECTGRPLREFFAENNMKPSFSPSQSLQADSTWSLKMRVKSHVFAEIP